VHARPNLVKVREETHMFAAFNGEQFRPGKPAGKRSCVFERHDFIRRAMHDQRRGNRPSSDSARDRVSFELENIGRFSSPRGAATPW